ncbi:hypothetical protein BDB01DRAFT_898185 [Pilobolus umbonatus]|nr:hypothetical protein BDB01DRAFT_898185 [Pilobolus umbonatus]
MNVRGGYPQISCGKDWMSATSSPKRDVVFIPESITAGKQSISYSKSNHPLDSFQEQAQTSKKPRNYKYWSDDEVRKILHWLTLPANEGKLARNKAQACREVASKLFDGDEYMAISVRSKLMSLEKNYKETESLKAQLTHNPEEDSTIIEKIKEISKFYKECKLLFGNKTDNDIMQSPASPMTPINSINNASLLTPVTTTTYPHMNKPSTLLPSYYENDTIHYDNNILPLIQEDRFKPLSAPTHSTRGSWSLPRVAEVDIPSSDIIDNRRLHHLPLGTPNPSFKISEKASIKIAKYAARQASFAAKQAEYEASKMEHAIRLAEIERDRDSLSIKKLELELELSRTKDYHHE